MLKAELVTCSKVNKRYADKSTKPPRVFGTVCPHDSFGRLVKSLVATSPIREGRLSGYCLSSCQQSVHDLNSIVFGREVGIMKTMLC